MSRVPNSDCKPIAGLYAAGSDQANVMGGHYPAGGINLGPALTFGYIAGRDLAGAGAYEDDGTMPAELPAEVSAAGQLSTRR